MGIKLLQTADANDRPLTSLPCQLPSQFSAERSPCGAKCEAAFACAGVTRKSTKSPQDGGRMKPARTSIGLRGERRRGGELNLIHFSSLQESRAAGSVLTGYNLIFIRPRLRATTRPPLFMAASSMQVACQRGGKAGFDKRLRESNNKQRWDKTNLTNLVRRACLHP